MKKYIFSIHWKLFSGVTISRSCCSVKEGSNVCPPGDSQQIVENEMYLLYLTRYELINLFICKPIWVILFILGAQPTSATQAKETTQTQSQGNPEAEWFFVKEELMNRKH